MSDLYTTETTKPTTRNAGASAGNKVRGAFQAVHGVGESIRGNTMSALDSMIGRGNPETDDIARRGQEETHRGVGNMRGWDDDPARVTSGQHPSTANPTYHDTAPSGATRIVTQPAGTRTSSL
ncbi:hypothetical protein EST38_g2843 [Candolleomyces aberdarensis]|uniref:Uncharacterized protein n=1 Tax=Candolleomyces aberdarensis TaxID=2316362 RepID=A0A4Q2DSI7_9AGAR|nr:hypothetical protein EST38_g2843 [Candolleomyces aberdarensis]